MPRSWNIRNFLSTYAKNDEIPGIPLPLGQNLGGGQPRVLARERHAQGADGIDLHAQPQIARGGCHQCMGRAFPQRRRKHG
jgi:hypothetical protein